MVSLEFIIVSHHYNTALCIEPLILECFHSMTSGDLLVPTLLAPSQDAVMQGRRSQGDEDVVPCLALEECGRGRCERNQARSQSGKTFGLLLYK